MEIGFKAGPFVGRCCHKIFSGGDRRCAFPCDFEGERRVGSVEDGGPGPDGEAVAGTAGKGVGQGLLDAGAVGVSQGRG